MADANMGSIPELSVPVDPQGKYVAPVGTTEAPSFSSQATSAKTDRSITASTSSQQAAPANASRRSLFVQNLDASINVHVNVGAVATTGAGSMRLAPGTSVELSNTNQAINVIAASGSPAVTIWEF